MDNESTSQMNIHRLMSSIGSNMVFVITNPVGFYKQMPKTGGLVDPLIFTVAMGILGAIVQIPLALFHLGMIQSFGMLLESLILMPILMAIIGFVGALILMLIWKIMGSGESYETAYRCAAYATAVSPITSLLNVIPYLGAIIGLAWMTYLLVTASVQVHSLLPRTSWIVFGIIAAILALMNISSQCATRRLSRNMESINKTMSDMEQMSPEEAGRKMGEFLKGMQEGAEK